LDKNKLLIIKLSKKNSLHFTLQILQ